MTEALEQASSVGNRHIIERPRLTRLLDETTARVILLVAPAGYGKTTLARQWLTNRPHVWFEATEACTDVVGLASALASTLEANRMDAGGAVSRRARLSTNARDDLSVLAELQARAVEPWPSGMWLVIDDYESLARSELAEEYVDLLRREADLRLLLTSRVRPRWMRAKALLYGHVCEVDVRDLAMREDEARRVLARGTTEGTHDVSAFDGWPAVVGLASLSSVPSPSRDDFARPLFQFFAEELFQRSSSTLQAALPQLALARWPEPELAEFLMGARKASFVLAEAAEMGFFSPTAERLTLHPLLRQFLLEKLAETPAVREASVVRVIDFLLRRGEWDAAFEVVLYARRPQSLIRLCVAGYTEMLALGRSETLVNWLQAAVELGATSGVFALIRAELALRHGDRLHARRLAEQVALSSENEFHGRAFQVCGRAAHLGEDEEGAVRCFEAAVRTARNSNDRRDALGRLALMAQSRDSLDEAKETLTAFLAFEPRSADDVLRAANVRFANAFTVGDVQGVLSYGDDATIALEHARDPAVRTSFLNAFSRCLSLQLRYEEAQAIATRLLDEAETARLEFVLPHAHVGIAVALVGLRRYVDAQKELDLARRKAEKVQDLHNLIDSRNVGAKAALARGRYEKALALTAEDDVTQKVTRVMRAELMATRGLVQACSGSVHEAVSTLQRAELVAAVVGFVRDDLDTAIAAFTHAIDVGVLDSIVLACRAHPALGRIVAAHSGMPPHLVAELQAAPGIDLKRRGDTLAFTAREEQVVDLLVAGRTNAEIARELVIAEVTAKVHVRNVMRKLGVRSRTEAAIAVLRNRLEVEV
jgi:DNA-binding NarL/FixJ family response regulator